MSYRNRENRIAINPMRIEVIQIDDESCKLVYTPITNQKGGVEVYVPQEMDGLAVKHVVIKPNKDPFTPDPWISNLHLYCSDALVEVKGKKHNPYVRLENIIEEGQNNQISLENTKISFDLTHYQNQILIKDGVIGFLKQTHQENELNYSFTIRKINADNMIDIEFGTHQGDWSIYNNFDLPDALYGMKIKNIHINREGYTFGHNDKIIIHGSNQNIFFDGGEFYQVENKGIDNFIHFDHSTLEKYTPSSNKEFIGVRNNSKIITLDSSDNDIVQISNSNITYFSSDNSNLRAYDSTLQNCSVSGLESLVDFKNTKINNLNLGISDKDREKLQKITPKTVISTDTEINSLDLDDAFQILSNVKFPRSTIKPEYEDWAEYKTKLSINKDASHPHRYYAIAKK